MKKLDYLMKYTWSDPALPYDTHWWHNRTTDYHCHVDYYELFLTVNDGLLQTYNGEQSMLEKHTVYLIPMHQYHKLEYVRVEGQMNIFNLSVNERLFFHQTELYSPLLMEKMLGKDLVTVPLDDTEFSFLKNLSEKLTYILDENKRLQIVRLYLSSVAVIFDMKFRNTAGLTQTELYAADLQTRIDNLEFIDRNIAEAYKRYPVSPSVLIAAFKRLTGQTIVKYHVARKMSYAATLLSGTDYTVLQISSEVGYDSLSHFINSFKSYSGETPSEYRKKNGGRPS